MKVYVIYDPLLEKVLCVHQYKDTECHICKPIRESRLKENSFYFPEELEHLVFNNVKKYKSAALGHNDIVEETNELIDKLETIKNGHREENICCADEEDQQPEMKFFNPKSGKMEKLFDENNLNKGHEK